MSHCFRWMPESELHVDKLTDLHRVILEEGKLQCEDIRARHPVEVGMKSGNINCTVH